MLLFFRTRSTNENCSLDRPVLIPVQRGIPTLLRGDRALTCAEAALVDGSDLRPQGADHRDVVSLPGEQAPDDAVRDSEVLLQNHGLIVGRGDGEVV